jgi:hypothetical protein
MITEKSIFTLEIPKWINKVRVGQLHYITPKLSHQSMKGATLRKIGAKQYYVVKAK